MVTTRTRVSDDYIKADPVTRCYGGTTTRTRVSGDYIKADPVGSCYGGTTTRTGLFGNHYFRPWNWGRSYSTYYDPVVTTPIMVSRPTRSFTVFSSSVGEAVLAGALFIAVAVAVIGLAMLIPSCHLEEV